MKHLVLFATVLWTCFGCFRAWGAYASGDGEEIHQRWQGSVQAADSSNLRISYGGDSSWIYVAATFYSPDRPGYSPGTKTFQVDVYITVRPNSASDVRNGLVTVTVYEPGGAQFQCQVPINQAGKSSEPETPGTQGKTQKVKFDARGGTCSISDGAVAIYTIGGRYGSLPTATRDGYIFDGWWSASEGTEVTRNSTVTPVSSRVLCAHWLPTTQRVWFNANGGICSTNTKICTIGNTYGTLPTATREGYIFSGWWTEPSGGTPVMSGSTVSLAESRTLYAQWQPIERQTVTFYAYGGNWEMEMRTYSVGLPYGTLPTVTRPTYVFAGWWTDRSGGEQVTADSMVMAITNRRLYAHWIPTKQTVTFDANGGVGEKASQVYDVGKPYGTLPTADREHYLFSGWWTATDGGTQVTTECTVVEEDTRILYAHWTPHMQTVTFDMNGGTCNTSNNVYDFEDTYGWFPSPTRTGFAFGGWLTEDGELIDETCVVPSNPTQTLYARWWGCAASANGLAVRSLEPAFGDVVIPSELWGRPVTCIESNAFSGCTNLTSVAIPDSVTSIGESAFSGCSTSIYDTASIEGALLVDGWVVGRTEALTPALDLTGVRGIADCVFSFCQDLWSVVVGNNVVTNIGTEAFRGCYGLRSVTICEGVTSIEERAFEYCSSLTNVTIPDSVTHIGKEAFSGCRRFGGIVDGWVVEGNSTMDWTGVRGIADWAFRYHDGLKSVTIPDTVTSIGAEAFRGCYDLTHVTILGGVRNIGEYAFCGCDMSEVMIPGSVTNIGDYAFYGCVALTNLTISEGVTSIGQYAFCSCRSLQHLTIPSSVESIGENAFGVDPVWPTPNALTSVRIMGNITNDWNDPYNSIYSPFHGCSNLTTIVLEDKMPKIGDGMFGGCVALSNVTIPDSVVSIGRLAFCDCSGLKNISIPNSVTDIGQRAFYGCSSLAGVKLPSSVTNIGWEAFYGCSSLTNVTIPDSVTSIGDGAFYGCLGLTSMTIPASVMGIGRNVFSGCRALKTLYVPESWKTKYVDGEFWSSYAAVPAGCEIVYRAPPTTRTGVPYAWLEEHGLGDGTAEGYEAAAAADAANGVNKAWECYVAGLDPTDPASRFTVEIVFTNGVPVVSWTPDLNEKGTKSERSYEVEGIPAMTNAWDATNAASRFFRVKVALPQP